MHNFSPLPSDMLLSIFKPKIRPFYSNNHVVNPRDTQRKI